MHDKFANFCKIGKQKKKKKKKSIGWAKHVYFLSEICAEGIFVDSPWWLKNVKSRSKMALFSNKCHLKFWFPKWKQLHFSEEKLSKLHKKDINFACDNYIFP